MERTYVVSIAPNPSDIGGMRLVISEIDPHSDYREIDIIVDVDISRSISVAEEIADVFDDLWQKGEI